MAAPAPLISVPKNLYKHFAVLTLVITASVAIFADGENKQVVVEQIEKHQAAKVRRAEAHRASDQTVNGLRDNRLVTGGNDDIGTPPPVSPQVATFADGELGEPDLAAAVRRQAPRKPARKLPAVLPPGMAPAPGLLPAAPAVTASLAPA